MCSTDYDVIMLAVEELTDEELDKVSAKVETIRKIRMRMLSPGMPVIWRDKNNIKWVGTVERINIKTVTLKDVNNPRWPRGVRIPLSWCTPA